MSVIYGILLAIIQGITEFLPVSSFGHLVAAEKLMGMERSTGLLFETMLHLGTADHFSLPQGFIQDHRRASRYDHGYHRKHQPLYP